MSDFERFVTIHDGLQLRTPVLIAAFRGWNDAGDSASHAAAHLGRSWSAKRLASIDPEEFYDFQANRPHVSLIDGRHRRVTWPANELWGAHIVGADRDVLIFVGTEPNLKWRTYSSLIVELARRYSVEMVITLGALLADVPHSRPVQITGTAMSDELIRDLHLERSRYEGPTGIVGVLGDVLSKEGLHSASLWAAVPHYLAVTPNPKAALALIEKASRLMGVPADISALVAATSVFEEHVAEMVAQDEDVQAYVRMLEERMDQAQAVDPIDPSRIPSGEALAQDFERFLRERERNGDD